MTAAPVAPAVPAITQYDVMTLLGTSVMGEPVVVELRYAADDPVTVSLSLHSAMGTVPRRSWTFERRLLDIGTDEPVEAGCVRIQPVWHPQSGTAVLFELAGRQRPQRPQGPQSLDDPEDVVAVRAELPAIRRFVDRIHREVPVGSEWQRLSLDRTLSDSSCFTTVE